MRRFLLIFASCWLALSHVEPAAAMPPGDDGEALVAVVRALDEVRIEDAARTLAPLAERYAEDPEVLFERGMLAYHQGDYVRAERLTVANVVRAVSIRDLESRLMLTRIARATQQATANMRELRDESGRHVVHFHEADALVAPYVLEVLRTAETRLGATLGTTHPGPIRVDIMPTTSALAAVSSLTVGEIERTGTIALCKWDRVILTSPRALVYGYPWADTLSHELVHLLVTRATHDRAPVWVQEGLARYFERSWRTERGEFSLDATSERLLVTRARAGELLPFERLHPSIAMLPSAEDAALAFAQVATFVGSVHRRIGTERLRPLFTSLRAGIDAREAFAALESRPFADLERDWRTEVDALPMPEGSSDALPTQMTFRHGEGDEAGAAEREAASIASETARRFVRLGDLLWSRSHPLAASREYARAYDASREDPVVASRYARSALAGGDAASALRVGTTLLALRPEHEPLLALVARASASLGHRDEARRHAWEAIWINPFDPMPHCALAEVETDGAVAERERRGCRE